MNFFLVCYDLYHHTSYQCILFHSSEQKEVVEKSLHQIPREYNKNIIYGNLLILWNTTKTFVRSQHFRNVKKFKNYMKFSKQLFQYIKSNQWKKVLLGTNLLLPCGWFHHSMTLKPLPDTQGEQWILRSLMMLQLPNNLNPGDCRLAFAEVQVLTCFQICNTHPKYPGLVFQSRFKEE